MHGWRRFRHRLLPLTSRLPNPVIGWLVRRWKLGFDPVDGWNYWMDASYAKYVRRDKRARARAGQALNHQEEGGHAA